jgi:hypothetical protein
MGGRTKWVLISSCLCFLTVGGFILLLSAGSFGEAGVGVGLGVDALFGTEGLLDFDAIVTSVQDILIIRSVKIGVPVREHQYITLCHTRA